MRILGINALYHDPSAALVVGGTTVAAAEEERFSRRKHGKRPVPFSAWEQPELSAACVSTMPGCHRRAGRDDISFDPALRLPPAELGLHDPWDDLRQTYAERAPDFLATAIPGLNRSASRSCRTMSRTPPWPASPPRSAATAPSWCWTVAGSGTAT